MEKKRPKRISSKTIKILVIVAFILNFIYSFFILHSRLPDYYRGSVDYAEGDIRPGQDLVLFPAKGARIYASPDFDSSTFIKELTEPICVEYGDIDKAKGVVTLVLDQKTDAFVPLSTLKYLPLADLEKPVKLYQKDRSSGEYYVQEYQWNAQPVGDGVSTVTLDFIHFSKLDTRYIYSTDGEKVWSFKRRDPWSILEYLPCLPSFIGIGIIILLAALILQKLINLINKLTRPQSKGSF